MAIELTNKLENGNHIVTLKVNGDEWKKILDKTKKELYENLEIKGFRKGKVPANIAEKHIRNQQIQGKATEKLVDQEYKNIMELLQKEKIISRPEVNIIKVSDSEVEATISSVIFPEMKLGKINNFKAKLKIEKVSDDEVNVELERFSSHLKENKEITEDRAIKEGDIVNLDYLGKKDGVAFEGGEGKGYDLKIGSKSFIPGFEEQLKGLKKGEEKVLNLTFPDGYHQKDLAGKEVTFDVKINKIMEEVSLEGEDLQTRLKAMGFKDEKDMKEKIEFMLNDRKQMNSKDKFFSEVVEEIIEMKETMVDIPEELIRDEVDNQLETFKQQLSRQGLDMKKYLEMIKKTENEFRNEQLKENAIKRIKQGLVYTELVKQHNIEVTDELVKKEMKKIAELQGVEIEELEKNINREQFDSALIFQELIEKIK